MKACPGVGKIHPVKALALVILLTATALARGIVIVPQPGSPEFERYALVVAMTRLTQDARVAPDRAQAERLLEDLKALQRCDDTNDRLFDDLLSAFTPQQRAYIKASVKRPKGACGCPCSTWNPVLRDALAVARKRAGLATAATTLPRNAPGDASNEPETLALLQGIVVLGDRLTPAQARALTKTIDRLAASVSSVQRHMRSIDRALTPLQRAWVRTESPSWFPGLTAAQLDERWEAWLAQGVRSMERVVGRP